MKRITQQEYENRVFSKHGKDIKVLGEYKNKRTKILVLCKCGYKWETNPEPLTRGHGCPKCAGNIRRTTEEFKDIVKQLTNNRYIVLGGYVNKDTPIKLKHLDCGLEFMMAPNAFINGQRCPGARYIKSANSNTIPLNEAEKLMSEATNGEYKIVGEYNGSSKKTEIKHSKCGKFFRQSPSRIIKGGIGCPYCYLSKGEEVVKGYLLLNGYDFKEQVRLKDCKHIRPLPFDFGIYADGKLIALIEYDGIQHYYPKFGDKQFKNTQRNDNIKNIYCEENKIPLIRIKYNRSENPIIFKEKITERLEASLLNMTIPSEASEKSLERVTTR